MAIPNFTTSVPVIGTSDVGETCRYFVTTLGFQQEWTWGEPPVYAGLRAGGAMLYITCDHELSKAIKERDLAPDIFLWVHDIERVFEQHRASGAQIAEELSARPWGVKQYVIREPNGYHLKIAESIRAEENS